MERQQQEQLMEAIEHWLECLEGAKDPSVFSSPGLILGRPDESAQPSAVVARPSWAY